MFLRPVDQEPLVRLRQQERPRRTEEQPRTHELPVSEVTQDSIGPPGPPGQSAAMAQVVFR
jgi:hypothetical protein